MTASKMVTYCFEQVKNLGSYFVDFGQMTKIFVTIENLFAHAVHDNLQDCFT